MGNYLVVGASSGIGLCLATLLAEEGHPVIGTQRSADNDPKVNGVTYQRFDATDSGAVLDLPDRLDGVVYCPGTISLKPFQSFEDKDYEHDWTVNFLGATRVIRQALPALKKSNQGSILLFSTVAVQTGLAYHASIAAAKGAIEGLTRSLAAELAPKIRVNAIAPSLTNTRLAEPLINTPEKAIASAQRHPLKRIGEPEEIAKAAQLLLSKDASFITGQVVSMDGGMGSVRIL